MLKTASRPKVSVNQETGIVVVKVNDNKVIESDSRGNCIIDFDEGGQVCRVEILPFDLPASD